MAFVNIDNRYSSALAMVAGVILTLTRPVLSNLLPGTASNPWAALFTSLSGNGVTVFWVLAGILSILVQIGGVTIVLGGVLCYANHRRLGKELQEMREHQRDQANSAATATTSARPPPRRIDGAWRSAKPPTTTTRMTSNTRRSAMKFLST